MNGIPHDEQLAVTVFTRKLAELKRDELICSEMRARGLSPGKSIEEKVEDRIALTDDLRDHLVHKMKGQTKQCQS